jgi:4-hydroxy-2-oxoheptanedioate aldolase
MTYPSVHNTFKEQVGSGEVVLGLWAGLGSSYAVEVIAGAGFDWILIDGEHSPADLENVLGQLQAMAAYSTSPVVRVPWNDTVTIKRYLDVGAQSLLIPYVQNADEARSAVANTRYPPDGVRGLALSTRASRFGRVPGYAELANDQMFVMVQIETARALDNLEEIAAVDGVDGLFIGPSDLHAGMGLPGVTTDPEVVALIDAAIARINQTGKASGVFAPIEEYARRWLEKGAQVVAVGADIGILARGSDGLLARFRGDVG